MSPPHHYHTLLRYSSESVHHPTPYLLRLRRGCIPYSVLNFPMVLGVETIILRLRYPYRKQAHVVRRDEGANR